MPRDSPQPVTLTADQIDTLRLHIKRTHKTAGCLRCGDNDWLVRGPVALDSGPGYDAAVFGTTAALVCKKCGFTEFIDLGVAGVT